MAGDDFARVDDSSVAAPPASKRLVALTRDGPEHRYVINRLCERFDIAAVIVDRRELRGGLRRGLNHGLRSFLSRAALKLYLKAIRDRAARERALQRILGSDMTSGWVAAHQRIVSVDGANSPESLEAARALEPDAILIYGTSIIRAPMLALARDMAFNMHTGLSPHYRGTHCAFWPIVNGEPHMLGATVHECTADIDGGQIFETANACPQPGDGLHECFARAVIAGTDAYIRVIDRYLAGTLKGEMQDLAIGREYRGHMRTLGAELHARRALRKT